MSEQRMRSILYKKQQQEIDMNQFIHQVSKVLQECTRSSIKINTILLKLKQNDYAIDRALFTQIVTAAEQDDIVGGVLISELIDGDDINNPFKKASKILKSIKTGTDNIGVIIGKNPKEVNIGNDMSAMVGKQRKPRAQKVINEDEEEQKTPNKPIKMRSQSMAPKKSILKKQQIESEDESSPIQIKKPANKCSEMSTMEFIDHISKKYGDLFGTTNLADVAIQAIKFINEVINDSGSVPNMKLLSYFDSDIEIFDSKINQYHYAPYLVNIAIGLVDQQKTDMSTVQSVFLNNVFRLLSICLQTPDQAKFIKSMQTQFNSIKDKKRIGLVIPEGCFSQLQKEFANSAQYLTDNSIY